MPDQSSEHSSPKGWRSWKLKLWCTIPIVVFQAAVLATIITLTVISELSDGFATVSTKNIPGFAGRFLHRQLLWTTLPAFVLALVNLTYTMVVNTAAERQPYEELVDKPKRSTAKLTILLDYASYPPLYNWWVAFRNGHPHLGGAMLVLFLCSFSLVPLTGGLFRPAETQELDNDVALQMLNRADFFTLDMRTNLQPTVDLSGAINAYGAQPLAWMTSKYAFDPFVTAEAPKVGNITATTSAYHVEPNCRSIDSAARNSSGLGSISFQFVDRGCQVVTNNWTTAAERDTYSFTWFQLCSDSLLPLDRVGMFSGIYAAGEQNNLANISVISCLPEYYNTTVNLTMAFDALGARRFVSTSEGAPTQMRMLNLRSVSQYLPNYRQSDLADAITGDTLGNAVHSYASALSPSSEFQPEVYRQATEDIFQTMFAGLVSTQLQQPRPAIVDLNGQQTRLATHLYVSLPVAAVICTLLLFMIICTIILIWHVERSSVALAEEAVGIFGKALVLLRSDVMDFARHVEARYPAGERVDQVKLNHTLASSECWVQGNIGSRAEMIFLGDLKEKESGYSVPSWWKRLFSTSPARRHEKQVKAAEKKAESGKKRSLSSQAR